jgi:hypothetical protein
LCPPPKKKKIEEEKFRELAEDSIDEIGARLENTPRQLVTCLAE